MIIRSHVTQQHLGKRGLLVETGVVERVLVRRSGIETSATEECVYGMLIEGPRRSAGRVHPPQAGAPAEQIPARIAVVVRGRSDMRHGHTSAATAWAAWRSRSSGISPSRRDGVSPSQPLRLSHQSATPTGSSRAPSSRLILRTTSGT